MFRYFDLRDATACTFSFTLVVTAIYIAGLSAIAAGLSWVM